MNLAPLNAYLERLDRALQPLAVADRADIVTEIKSHVLDALEKDPSQSIQGVLASLGEPEAVASRYLIERGHKPKKPSKNPMIQWLVIGFLGTLSILALTLVVLVWKFTPLIEVDGSRGSVSLLGGLLQVRDDSAKGTFHFEGLESLFGDDSPLESRSDDVNAASIHRLRFQFSNGKVDVLPSQDGKISYRCDVSPDGEIKKSTASNTLTLDATGPRKIRCEVRLPKSIKPEITGSNGKISISKPSADATLRLSNGKIEIAPDAHTEYRYDLRIRNGSIDRAESSDKKNAIQIVADLGNGKISVDD